MADTLAERRAVAERRVEEAQRVVERQRKIVATFDRRRVNSSDARALLAIFEQALAGFEDDLESILKQQQGK